jgi:hypothetical protein
MPNALLAQMPRFKTHVPICHLADEAVQSLRCHRYKPVSLRPTISIHYLFSFCNGCNAYMRPHAHAQARMKEMHPQTVT